MVGQDRIRGEKVKGSEKSVQNWLCPPSSSRLPRKSLTVKQLRSALQKMEALSLSKPLLGIVFTCGKNSRPTVLENLLVKWIYQKSRGRYKSSLTKIKRCASFRR